MAEQTTTDSEPILALSTLTPVRPTVEIDTELYELRVLEHDFSADDHACFQADLDEFDRLWERDKRSAAQGKRMSMLLDKLIGRVVIDLPKKVRTALSDEQKRAVVVAFQYAPALAEAMARAEKETAETEN